VSRVQLCWIQVSKVQQGSSVPLDPGVSGSAVPLDPGESGSSVLVLGESGSAEPLDPGESGSPVSLDLGRVMSSSAAGYK
jgi:hypothetical protein